MHVADLPVRPDDTIIDLLTLACGGHTRHSNQEALHILWVNALFDNLQRGNELLG